MTIDTSGPKVSIQDVRSQLAQQLALTLIVAGLAWISLTWPNPNVPYTVSVPIGLAVAGLGGLARYLGRQRPTAARWLLTVGLSLALWSAMAFWAPSWLPFLGIALAFVAALLVPGGELATSTITFAWAALLTATGQRDDALLELALALAFAALLAWQTVRTVYTAYGWVWSSQQRADQLLREARDYQAELGRVMKSLDSSNQSLRRTQADLIAARKRAESAESAKSQFVANISHELATPLNLIVGFSEVMHLTPEVYGDAVWPPTLRRDIYQVYRSSRHLLGLIDDVFDLSRFDMIGFALNREPTPLEPLLLDTAEFVRDLFQGQAVRFEVDIAGDLPSIEIDRTRIRQVLLNLLNNARHFTEKGSVTLSARASANEVVVGVRDTGPGIAPDKVARVFEEFYQVDPSLRRRHGGAGLGLALSKRFVEAHHGRIWVESVVGEGTTFFFALPNAERRTPTSPFRPIDLPDAAPLPCVVMVDPDPRVAGLLRHQLKTVDIVSVRDLADAPQAIAQHHPRAVIHNARPDTPPALDAALTVPVIQCSLPSQSWLARDFAAAACLTKPFTADALLDEIGRLGDVRRALIVGQDRDFCQLVERMLTARGACETRRAYDAADAIEALQEEPCDLILLNDDSLELLSELKRETTAARPPVIVFIEAKLTEAEALARGREFRVTHPQGLTSKQVLQFLTTVVDGLETSYMPEEVEA